MGLRDVPLVGGPVEIRGVAEVEPTAEGLRLHRLPAAARAQLPDDFLRMTQEQPSGARLALRTTARRLELDVRLRRTLSVNRPSGEPGVVPPAQPWEAVADGDVVATVVPGGGHGLVEMDYATRRATWTPAPVVTLAFELPPGASEVEVWPAFGEVVTLVALRADGDVAPPRPAPGPRWVHHGSSISHGASADRPTGTWVAVAARALGLDLVNLGFSGNAVLDPFVARAIRDQPADLITLKLGINVVNHDVMRRRAFVPAVEGFLDTIREGHPTTPVVVISPILCPIVEDRPGPTSIDPASPASAPVFRTTGRPEELTEGKLSLRVIREVLAAVVRRRAAEDPNLTYLDGRELFGPAESDAMPLPDRLHPDAAGQRHIGERFAGLLPTLAPGLL
ncbi:MULTISPECIES: GDSL-type esterase/lipase family protein [unclassified Actinotalea]|uniref:GDSL-type esterase/lipase family protein n=1 Tax=unclassified Actinotalea TaxID=2638618 RepID=UPI0015F576AD|nr:MULTISPECIES: GDSL-type esterase/lipase family protein [unclassified Actinotalea]